MVSAPGEDDRPLERPWPGKWHDTISIATGHLGPGLDLFITPAV
jgi:hypothetical protein